MTPEEQILLRVKTDKMILDKMQETNTLLKDIKDKEMPEAPEAPESVSINNFPEEISVKLPGVSVITLKGDKGDTPTDEELLALIKPLIPEDPEDGHTPTKEELLALIRPLIPVVKDGETPTDSRLISLIEPLLPKKEAIVEEVLTKIPPPPFLTSIEIRDRLEILKGDERLDVSAIKGISEIQESIKELSANGVGRVGWGAHPLNIQESGTVKAKGARHLNFTGAAVTHSANGVTTIAVSSTGNSIHNEQVSGNTNTFTLAHTPTLGTEHIFARGQRIFPTTGYTIVGAIITTVDTFSTGDIYADYSY